MILEAKLQDIPRGALKLEYEPEVDILTIYLRDPETSLSYSSEAEPGIILNYAKDNSLTSIEIIDASRRYPSGQLAASSVGASMAMIRSSATVPSAQVTV